VFLHGSNNRGWRRVSDPTLNERMARVETVLEKRLLPGMERMEAKLDGALESVQEKGSRQSVADAHQEIDKIQLALEKKADKTEVEQVQRILARWAGIGVAVAILLGWYGQKLLGLLVK
jgi:CHASE3 domain sensor protein